MKDTIKGIIIGVVSSLIASGIIYDLILLHKIRDVISEYTEGTFGDSYVYTWEFKRNRKGQYNVYGYEATKIALKKPLAELSNEHIFTCGHEVPEYRFN